MGVIIVTTHQVLLRKQDHARLSEQNKVWSTVCIPEISAGRHSHSGYCSYRCGDGPKEEHLRDFLQFCKPKSNTICWSLALGTPKSQGQARLPCMFSWSCEKVVLTPRQSPIPTKSLDLLQVEGICVCVCVCCNQSSD